jgi:predicted RNA-binding Zn ribbon-like protein
MESLVLPIGDAWATCVCAEDVATVKACAGHSCTLVFAGRHRRQARRWGRMAIGGNRANQAAHRNRLKHKH